MFVCKICKSVVHAGIPAQKVVLETRAVRYPARHKIYPPTGMSFKAQRALLRKDPDRMHDDFRKWDSDPGGHGLEIVREGLACPDCASRLELKAVWTLSTKKAGSDMLPVSSILELLRGNSLTLRQQLPQHKLQNPTVAVVTNFNRCINLGSEHDFHREAKRGLEVFVNHDVSAFTFG